MNHIELDHFRCYENQTIDFKPGVNLLIGDNASGKTSILKACKYVLSAFFSGFSDENTKWTSPSKEDFYMKVKDGVLHNGFRLKIRFQFDENVFTAYQFSSVLIQMYNTQGFVIAKHSPKNSRALTSGLKGFKEYAKELKERTILDGYNSNEKSSIELPLFAAFSTEDIHSNRKLNDKPFRKYYQSRSFGYYECLEGNGFYPYWRKRLLVLQEGQKNLEEIQIVTNAIKDAFGPEGCNIIADMQVRPQQGCVYYILSDGREVESELLSDGYKRLVNIVTDIAFRCALLNRAYYSNEATYKTKGTVLIDEIDMHLHPSLQATILKGLHHAFPQLQFIVATHAPMVMSGVSSDNENAVFKLDYNSTEGYSINEVTTYGLDLSTITKAILNQTPRNPMVQSELEKLFDLIDQEKYKEAKTSLQRLKNRYGNLLPELTEAETIIGLESI